MAVKLKRGKRTENVALEQQSINKAGAGHYKLFQTNIFHEALNLNQTMSLEELSTANDSLRFQIDELREAVACLDSENRELLNENHAMKIHHQSLQGMADQFKATMESLQKIVEDVREKMDSANSMIHELEMQNKSLVKANEDLSKEMREVSSQVAFFKKYKAAQEKDLREMRNLSAEVKKHLRNLEDKLAETEHGFHVEKSHATQLREKVAALLKLRENQRKDIKDLQTQLEACIQQATFLRLDEENRVQVGSMMHEVVEAKLVDVALNRSKKRKVLYCLWMFGKIMLVLLFGFCLLLGLILSYTYFFNQEFISETFLLFLTEHSIEQIVNSFSQLLTWRNDGLLPF